MPALTCRLLVIALMLSGAIAARGQAPATVPAPAAAPKISAGVLLAPKAFRAAARQAQASMVRIETFGGLAGPAAGAAPGEGPTTGVIVSSDGLILTSTFNFLKKPPIITVVLPSGERKVAQMLGRDDTRKLCLLKIDATGLTPAVAAPRDELQVGQWVVALGVGYGDAQPALSAGIISATSRISARAVQTDANLSPANYGGPLIDLDGRVIGVCVPLSPQSRETAAGAEWYDSGIGFAVPLAGLEPVLAKLKEGQHIQPGYLGVQAQPKGAPPKGAHVAKVLPKSPAEKAGLKEGDQIVSVAGTEILDVTHLVNVVGRYAAGDRIQLAIKRQNEDLQLEAELAVPPPPEKPQPPKGAKGTKKPEGEKKSEGEKGREGEKKAGEPEP